MQLAGQIVGQRPQATHLGRPSACLAMTCVPRQRVESSGFSSGYSIVTLAGFARCLNVSAMPRSVARKYDVFCSGRLIVLTVIAISILLPSHADAAAPT